MPCLLPDPALLAPDVATTREVGGVLAAEAQGEAAEVLGEVVEVRGVAVEVVEAAGWPQELVVWVRAWSPMIRLRASRPHSRGPQVGTISA